MPLELLVDLGSSRIKWLPVVDGAPQWRRRGGCVHHRLAAEWPFAEAVERAVLASVAPASVTADLSAFLSARSQVVEQVATGDPRGQVEAAYPGLGVDRWLALQAVRQLSPGPFLIADCGSALTLDLLDRDGVHRGGWITAGLAAARAGLAELAPALPDFDPGGTGDAVVPVTGTAGQIARGLLLQQAATVERAWRACSVLLGRAPSLLLTGGDASAVQSVLEVPSRRDEALVFKGLMTLIAGESAASEP